MGCGCPDESGQPRSGGSVQGVLPKHSERGPPSPPVRATTRFPACFCGCGSCGHGCPRSVLILATRPQDAPAMHALCAGCQRPLPFRPGVAKVPRSFRFRSSEFGFSVAIHGSHARPKSDSRCRATASAEIVFCRGNNHLEPKTVASHFLNSHKPLRDFSE